MRKPATYKGECQVCGRTQKLPSGLMASHGYTVEWGFFDGICAGSGALPWEQDYALVAEAIRGAKSRRTYLEKRIKELKEDTTPENATGRYYIKNEGYRRAWVPTDTIIPAANGSTHSGQWVAPVTVVVGGSESVYKVTFGYRGPSYGTSTAVEAAYRANVMFAEDLKREDWALAQEYIVWQTSRLKAWTVQPLRQV